MILCLFLLAMSLFFSIVTILHVQRCGVFFEMVCTRSVGLWQALSLIVSIPPAFETITYKIAM